MRFYPQILTFLAVFTAFFLSACSPSQFQAQIIEQFSYEKSSSEIRYENFSDQGDIQEAAVISDPLRESYAKGPWDELDKKSFKISAVQSSGPTANRVNIVFVGDGYTVNELGDFAKDVIVNRERMLLQQPFKAYQNYFSFHQVEVISSESGVSVLGLVTKNTALEMQYGCGGLDRLLCINLSKAAAAAQKAPKADMIFALANSDRYGGAGYMSPAIATLAARNPAATEVAMHELGHSFGKLTDEYDYAGIQTDCSKYANTSLVDRLKMRSQKSKWFRWLDLSHIGAFQGSCYNTKHFRPTLNSKMRALHEPYEEINTEQLIFKIYEKVRPIEYATPSKTFKSHQNLRIGVMKQLETDLEIAWMVNGSMISHLQGRTQIQTAELGLGKGTHQISVTVTDRTQRVRNEEMRKKWMSQSVQWKLKL